MRLKMGLFFLCSSFLPAFMFLWLILGVYDEKYRETPLISVYVPCFSIGVLYSCHGFAMDEAIGLRPNTMVFFMFVFSIY